MQLLIADIGNSLVTVAAGAAGAGGTTRAPEARPWRRLHQEATPRTEPARKKLAARLVDLVAREPARKPVLVSVVPLVTEAMKAVVPDVISIDHTAALPFELGVTDPAAVGADRYCNVAAAVAAGWREALVVDAGTATTFDLLLDGVFAGGLIAPGMAFAARSLGEVAARLQPEPFVSCPLEVGTDTAAAMRIGAYHVATGGVLTTVQALLERYGERPVVLTGGLGEFLQAGGWLYDADWTFRGAAHLVRRPLEEC